MIKIFRYFKKTEWIITACMIAIVVVQAYLMLKMPEYVGKITNLISPKEKVVNFRSELWQYGFAMLGFAIATFVAAIGAGFTSSLLGSRVGKNLRTAVFNKVESFSLGEINKFSTPSLITRSVNDIQQISMAITMGLRFIIFSPIVAIMAIIKIVGQNYKLSLVTALTIVGMGIFFALITILILPRFGVMQKQVDKVNGVTRENLTGLRVVRAYNAEDYQEKKFDKANNDLTKTWLFVNRVMILMDPMMTLVMNGINLGIVWFGAYLMSTNQAVIADLTTFTMYSMQIIISVIMIVSIFIFVPRAFVSAKRVFAVLDTPLSIHDGEGIPPEKQGSVEFRDVCFKYPDAEEYVLSNISFRAEKGETVAFIGSTGSGKSTLIKMIPRFYDAIEGEILIDGSNIKDFKLSELRKRIGYVPQRGILFSGTIRSNIEFGDTPEDEEMMKKAADIACATEFISQRQDEFDAPIAQGGTNVSGGQKQRLSIARALARKPEIMVFDDSFSALDFKTDKLVRSNLKQNTDATILIVAQRIGTIKNADRIIVLDQGRIVGNGKHSDLLQSCKIYREIAQSQLSKEELA